MAKKNKKVEIAEALNQALIRSQKLAKSMRHEFCLPEHFLIVLCDYEPFRQTLNAFELEDAQMRHVLLDYLQQNVEQVPDGIDYEVSLSAMLAQAFQTAVELARTAGLQCLEVEHLVATIYRLKDSFARNALHEVLAGCDDDGGDVTLATLISDMTYFRKTIESKGGKGKKGKPAGQDSKPELDFVEEDLDDPDTDLDDDDFDDLDDDLDDGPFRAGSEKWTDFATCLDQTLDEQNPLVGRAHELERTMQVLCRKDKNNPLHIGDPGVGKTAIIYGLARRLKDGDNVPERLKGYKIFQVDMADMVAGTQYRGDFEKRLKMVMNALREQGKAIVYIDEIHNIVGAGASAERTLDASNMLKPYLEDGTLRFIGSTTFDEYKRTLAGRGGMVRRFQQIDIPEPSQQEATEILMGIKAKYEAYHGVSYDKDVIAYAVKASAEYIHGRALPDKAIDLIDEAGAYLELHPVDGMRVSVELVSEVLAKMCKVESLKRVATTSDEQQMATLLANVQAKIFGQDEAVRKVVEAVQMSRAGLVEEGKPVASLLFVGPTGVGKTEVARVLAAELGLELVRFDMSEYAEKHTIAKLIGSPAGYVGYDDGGLLTDAIRKTPNCVLLLDEIEKAHSDIYNILLQVMDYASLTDSKGRPADFRHVVLIMTSNAGAQYAGRSVGFSSATRRGDAMMKSVKATFKPEFLNRLSGTVVFNDMSRDMAALILQKKLGQLQKRLEAKQVTIVLSEPARQWLLNKGFTPEYGAREIDRVINSALKPLLMREILFGTLKNGGRTRIDTDGDTLKIETN